MAESWFAYTLRVNGAEGVQRLIVAAGKASQSAGGSVCVSESVILDGGGISHVGVGLIHIGQPNFFSIQAGILGRLFVFNARMSLGFCTKRLGSFSRLRSAANGFLSS